MASRIIILGFLLLAYGCAQIVIPAGGPKDLTPPRVEKYIPDSAATNFNAKTITIAFDEFIQLSDLQRELTISPPMKIQPEVKVKGKVLLIEINDTLKKNTTYALNFGSAIRDFTEANAKKDFQYIFSTGSYIDTLKLSGTVKNAFDLKTEKGILVMLYESVDDSVPYKQGPSYFAKTNPDGSYRITNIRPGRYKAFALKETNANYKYDAPDESIAFSDTLIKISKNTKLDLKLFREEPRKQRLLKSSVRGYGQMMLTYAKPVTEISYKPLNSGTKTETFITEFNTGRDSVQIWFPVFSKDTLYFKIIADKTTIDTMRTGTGQFRKESGGRGVEFKLTATANVKKDKTVDINKMTELYFNHPVKTYSADGFELRRSNVILPHKSGDDKPDSCVLSRESLRSYSISSPSMLRDSIGQFLLDSTGNTIFSLNPLPADTGKYSLFIPPGTFTDIFDLTNDTIKLDFRVQEEKFYGTLKMNIKMPKQKSPCIVQFTDEKGNLITQDVIGGAKILDYSYLYPGKCKMRMIYDTDGDGKWTTGNYTTHRQAEKIIYFPGEINIRSNWDLELDWKVE